MGKYGGAMDGAIAGLNSGTLHGAIAVLHSGTLQGVLGGSSTGPLTGGLYIDRYTSGSGGCSVFGEACAGLLSEYMDSGTMRMV
jgi:hypothetical protein